MEQYQTTDHRPPTTDHRNRRSVAARPSWHRLSPLSIVHRPLSIVHCCLGVMRNPLRKSSGRAGVDPRNVGCWLVDWFCVLLLLYHHTYIHTARPLSSFATLTSTPTERRNERPWWCVTPLSTFRLLAFARLHSLRLLARGWKWAFEAHAHTHTHTHAAQNEQLTN